MSKTCTLSSLSVCKSHMLFQLTNVNASVLFIAIIEKSCLSRATAPDNNRKRHLLFTWLFVSFTGFFKRWWVKNL